MKNQTPPTTPNTILNTTALNTFEKTSINTFITYFKQNKANNLASRTLILYGSPGVGKTHLARQLTMTIKEQILYLAPSTYHLPNSTRISNITDILHHLKANTKQLLFIDDLSALINTTTTPWGEVDNDNEALLLEIVETILQDPTKLLLMTTNSFRGISESIYDRIEIGIHLECPTTQQKHSYLKSNHQDHLTQDQITTIAKYSIGYNFRDLNELIRLSYRIGNNKITKKSLSNALHIYKPSQLYGCHIWNQNNPTFKDIIGKTQQKAQLKTLIQQYQNPTQTKHYNIKRHNLLLFHGPPGSGKTYMVKALAGELDYPIIHLNSKKLLRDPFEGIERLTDLAKRYKNCIIFVDEAEKILGNPYDNEDTPSLAELHQLLDGIDSKPIESIIIFAVNNITRFSHTLLDRFTPIQFTLPDLQERHQYFKNKPQHPKLQPNQLALKTHGMTFRDLDRIWDTQISHVLFPNEKLTTYPQTLNQYQSEEIMFQ